MVTLSLLVLAAASIGSSVFAAPKLKNSESLSAKQEVAKRVCPISCPPNTVFKPPCRCNPIPAVKKQIRPPVCDVFCEFGRASGDGCQCNPDPRIEKRTCAIHCPFGYDQSIACKCLPDPDIEKRAQEQCTIYCPFGYDTSVPCTCLPNPSIRCGNICLPGTKHDPHAAGVCNCVPYHPCDLEARCVAGELFAWDDGAQTCRCLKRKDTCIEDVTCLPGLVWQYESESRVCKCLRL